MVSGAGNIFFFKLSNSIGKDLKNVDFRSTMELLSKNYTIFHILKALDHDMLLT